jgi:hypothetical protein
VLSSTVQVQQNVALAHSRPGDATNPTHNTHTHTLSLSFNPAGTPLHYVHTHSVPAHCSMRPCDEHLPCVWRGVRKCAHSSELRLVVVVAVVVVVVVVAHAGDGGWRHRTTHDSSAPIHGTHSAVLLPAARTAELYRRPSRIWIVA